MDVIEEVSTQAYAVVDVIGAFYYGLRKENFTAIPVLNAATMF